MTKVVVKVKALLPSKELEKLKNRLEKEAKEDSFVILPHYCDYTIVEIVDGVIIEMEEQIRR